MPFDPQAIYAPSPFDRRIGELCREGRTMFYTFLFGGIHYVESEDREYIRRLHLRWASRAWTGDYLEEIKL